MTARPWIRPLLLAVLALAVVAGGWWAWKTWGASRSKPDEYIFGTVQRGDIEDLVGATGSLQPRDYVDVGAQVSGQLKKLHVDVGSEVKEGQLLAEIDAEQSAARVDANRASLRAQQATLVERQVNLEKAERDLQRQRNLMAEEATTTEQVQNAETAAARRAHAAQFAEGADRAAAGQHARRGSQSQVHENLRADGGHGDQHHRAPGTDAEHQPVGADVAAHRRPVDDDGADAGRRGRRQQAASRHVELFHDARQLRAGAFTERLRKIEPTPTVTNNVVLYNALFDVPNPNRMLMPQMTAQVFFVVAEARDVLVVPVSALTFARAAPQRPPSTAAAAGSSGGDRPSTPATDPATATTSAQPAVDGAAKGRRAEGGDRPRGAGRGATGSTAQGRTTTPPKSKWRAPTTPSLERDVMVGVSSRVSAEIIFGTERGRAHRGRRQGA